MAYARAPEDRHVVYAAERANVSARTPALPIVLPTAVGSASEHAPPFVESPKEKKRKVIHIYIPHCQSAGDLRGTCWQLVQYERPPRAPQA